MKHNAPPIVGSMDFLAMQNEFILVEMDNNGDIFHLLREPLSGKININFSAALELEQTPDFDFSRTVIVKAKSVYSIFNAVKSMPPEYAAAYDYLIIDRIDMMDNELSPRERGSQQAAFISMIAAPQFLKGKNVIVTSANKELSIRKRASSFFDLRNFREQSQS